MSGGAVAVPDVWPETSVDGWLIMPAASYDRTMKKYVVPSARPSTCRTVSAPASMVFV
jgi:hypothetical protein